MIRTVALVLLILAAIVFSAASVAHLRKGWSEDAFKDALFAIGCIFVVVLII